MSPWKPGSEIPRKITGALHGSDPGVLERLKSICQRYEELSRLLCDPEVIGDPERLRKVSKEQADLEEIYRAACEYREIADQLEDARSMLEEKLDNEMREWVKEEIDQLSSQIGRAHV